MRFDFRFAFAGLVLACTAIVLDLGRNHEVLPPRQPLDSLPHELGIWRGFDMPIASDVRDILGQGEFLERRYQDASQSQSYVDLFMAYFPSQRDGETIHSPQHCIPGDGWFPLESSRFTLALPDHAPFPANRYLIAKGDDRALVVYWFWAHGRALANEYWAKYYLVADTIRLNRSDGAMIRLSTAIRGETVTTAQQRMMAFAEELVPIINRYAPD